MCFARKIPPKVTIPTPRIAGAAVVAPAAIANPVPIITASPRTPPALLSQAHRKRYRGVGDNASPRTPPALLSQGIPKTSPRPLAIQPIAPAVERPPPSIFTHDGTCPLGSTQLTGSWLQYRYGCWLSTVSLVINLPTWAS